MNIFADFNKVAEELSCNALRQLRKFVLDVPKNPELFSDSAHYERVDKLVLWNSDDRKMQICLPVYPGSANSRNLVDISDAHNHRWNFSTRILLLFKHPKKKDKEQ